MRHRDDDTDEVVIEGQPCLELEPRPGHVGGLFALAGETFIGNSWRAHVPVIVNGMNDRHARVFPFEGAWYLQNVNPRTETTVNGLRIGNDARLLEDGDRISLDRGLAALRFHARRPSLVGVTSYVSAADGAWVTFCPWSADPRCEYALAHDGVVRTACGDDRVSTFTSRSFAAVGVLARFDDGTRVYDDDVAGVRWSDLLWRTNEQRATVDGRLLLAIASLMMRGGDLFHSRMFVTWSGRLAWHARAAPPPRPLPPTAAPPQAPRPVVTEAMRQASRPAHLVHLVATAAGCTRVRRTSEFLTPDDFEVLLDHKKALTTLPLESDVRTALARMIDAALASPHSLADVIERERNALGALDAEDTAGLVARVFPDEHAQHQRIVEDARLLGVEGIARLRR